MDKQLTANSEQSNEPKGIQKLFSELSGMYGSKFADLWGSVDADTVERTWIRGLAGLTGEEIIAGLEACMTRPYPPTLPEFRNLCRPALDMHSMLLVAIREMGHRRNHEPQAWPSNRLFWTAQRLAHELRTVEKPELLLRRFELAWFDAAKDADKAIPDVSPENALPAPGKTFLSKEEAKQRADEIGLATKKAGLERHWAFDIAGKPEMYPAPSIEASLKALKTWGIAWPLELVERARVLGLKNIVDEVTA